VAQAVREQQLTLMEVQEEVVQEAQSMVVQVEEVVPQARQE
jgi:hypothetical protein